MILPDVNLLLNAYDTASPLYPRAKNYVENLLSHARPVGFPWAVLLAFVRLSTQRRVFEEPYSVREATDIVRAWLARPQVQILHPGDEHARILFDLQESVGTAGNLTTDAHLAALAIEYQCELHSQDADFARFPGLKWRNPLR